MSHPPTPLMNSQPSPTRKYLYAFLTDEEYKDFCTVIRTMAYPTTSAYITAVARVTLYGWHTRYHAAADDLDPATAAWIAWHQRRMTAEDTLRQQFFDVLTDLAFPVIAARGAQLAFHLLQTEIETALAERCGLVPSYDCMKTWTQVYETIYRQQLDEHRAGLARESSREREQLLRQEETARMREVLHE